MPAFVARDSMSRPAGYEYLVERLGLRVIPNWHESRVATSGGTHRIDTADGVVTEGFPSSYWPGDGLGDHLEFALKYDGTNLGILANVFRAADPGEIAAHVGSRPLGKYARRLWYFYELITGRRWPEDLTRGNYVDALETGVVLHGRWASKMRRQRINDNLPGTALFCPLVRRTEKLRHEAAELKERCRGVVAGLPPGVAEARTQLPLQKRDQGILRDRALPT